MAEIRFSAIRKQFGAVVAVNDFSIDIADGEFVALVGPSGCGKTTLLRILAGLEQPTAGRIHLAGEDITDKAARDRNLAMVFQNYALYPHMTVADNIGFALKLRGRAKDEIAREVAKSAALLGIESLLDRRPRELSGGQRQRVAVCRAIVRHPAAFLFDEPLSNLDARLRTSARAEIRGLQQRLATTAVYVTHDQVEAMTMADRIVVMNGGRVQQIGRPLEVYECPANAFVAGFIGSPAMNLIPATRGSDGSLATAGFALGPVAARAVDTAAVVGVRPEDIRVRAADCAQPLAFKARLNHVEPLGAEVLLHLGAGDQTIQARIPGRWNAAAGGDVDLFVDAARLHVFCAETGRRLWSASDR